jgi:hypothetical protein
MGNIEQDTNAPMNTLKPQPGQWGSYNPKFHSLPGDWAKKQLMDGVSLSRDLSSMSGQESRMKNGSGTSTEIQRALAAERAQHEYWEKWQGVTPGKAIYENPRELQNTLLPSAKYGTEGRGYG